MGMMKQLMSKESKQRSKESSSKSENAAFTDLYSSLEEKKKSNMDSNAEKQRVSGCVPNKPGER